MAARSGMANLINELRQATFVGTADYTLGTVTYWTDDQLQTALDRQRRDLFFVPLELIPQMVAGAMSYTNYGLPAEAGQWYEEIAPGTSTFMVRDYNGGSVSMANYSVNYQARMITFSANTGGSVLYADCHTYDLYAAAADIWGQKAAYYSQNVDWQSDNHRVSASQQYANAIKMQREYLAKSDSSVKSVRFRRDDEMEWDNRGTDGVLPDYHWQNRHRGENEGWI